MKTYCALLFCLLTSGISFGQSLNDSLIYHYMLDGNALDASGNGHNGVFNAGSTTDRFGIVGGASAFNGTNTYIDLPNDPSLKPSLPVTIAVWVYVADPTSGTDVQCFTNDYNQNNYHGIWFTAGGSDGKVAVCFGAGAGNTGSNNRRTKSSVTNMPANTWTHLTFVVRGANDMDIYINCVNDGGTYSGTGGALQYSTVPGSIGRTDADVTAPSHYFDGALDDLMMWSRELSPTEIASLCNKAYITEIEETAKLDAPLLYPNPTNNILTFELPSSATCEIFNSMGQLVDNTYLNQGAQNLDVSSFVSGLYTIRFVMGDAVRFSSFVKN